ncbi:CgeB family protein [Oceanirhabdus seepicola]|uniref:Glycosyltransferase family 1 protein n=1 Tax=Oceanirhabdus seepicola TaxID=2828781 RepID=A0A9J6NXU5_9CLOT|nr:glycosyltransferase [Oceanirhabdus seepicola]MCM1989274.1 glycosyltransferase family 1 protein [Oceanirhabdus seepicola]
MKWIIKNPAPLNQKWGDFYFGRSLTKYLKRLGHEVKTHYYEEWNNNEKADVILVLRGYHLYKPINDGAINIMWNISHPDFVSLEEYESYDIVFVASETYARELKKRVTKPVYPLLQCTDPEQFYIKDSLMDSNREGIIFVGGTRGVKRSCVIWSIKHGFPIKVWGGGWQKFINKEKIVAGHIENEEIPNLYSQAKVILNDHWADMLKYGFINNRTFDALACGLPIISDFNEELFKLFPTEILYYRNEEEFIKCIKNCDLNYLQIKKRVNNVIPKIRDEFSFENRVRMMLKKIEQQ